MQKLYRTDYEGEFVVDGFIVKDGRRQENRIFLPNTISNNQHTGNACIIGNGRSRLDLDIKKVTYHAGGHLGKRRLQTYGCNALYRDTKVDFLVATNSVMVNEIVRSGYAKDHVVMSNATNLVQHPGDLHLIPYQAQGNTGYIATFLACFDGHKKVYLLGFDNQSEEGGNNNVYTGTPNYAPADKNTNSSKWEAKMKMLFDRYSDVEFTLVVGKTTRFPEAWKYCLNLREVSIRDFVLEVDL